MTSFSEKTVRGISLLFLVIFGFLTYKNYYYEKNFSIETW